MEDSFLAAAITASLRQGGNRYRSPSARACRNYRGSAARRFGQAGGAWPQQQPGPSAMRGRSTLPRASSSAEKSANNPPSPPTGDQIAVQPQTPAELLESQYQALRRALAEDLLEQVKLCSPEFFEQLV